jgi:hypothetical protein
MAFGNATFSDIGTAVSDIFAAQGDELKAKGAAFEQQSYVEAAALAKQNEAFTEMSTAIKQSQADRNLYQALGTTRADVAGAGFAASGSAPRHPAREREPGRDDQGGAGRTGADYRGRLSGAGAELHRHGECGRRCHPGRQARCNWSLLGRWHQHGRRPVLTGSKPASRAGAGLIRASIF